MQSIRSVFRILALVATLAGTASAQTPPAMLQTLVSTPQYQANIARLFSQLPPEVFQRCATLVSKGSQVTVVISPTFAKDGYPVSGLWKQSFPVSGCGNDTTINFFFRGDASEKISSIVAMPGDTHADLLLQKDAVQNVLTAAHARLGDCSALHIRTTSYDGVDGPTPGGAPNAAVRARAWRETWTVAACGKTLPVPLRFIPDATGTQIVVELPKPSAG